MATYVVGDVQGCYRPLRCLLDQVGFDPRQDRLWLTGDLVNRGPQSLEVLRYVRELGDAAVTILGNHDLHLLAVAQGVRAPHRKDTFREIFAADDCDELLDWLLRQPLLHYEHGYLMVHAGLPPQWDLDQTLSLAAEVEAALGGPDRAAYFDAMYGNDPDCWDEALKPPDRWRVITNYLTRMRLCTADGNLDLKHKGPPEEAPPGYRPWFVHAHRRSRGTPILFGHWAALEGRCDDSEVIALDTGCVWGRMLRMIRLDDRSLFHCDCD